MLRPFLLLLYAGLSLVTLQVHALGLLAVDYGSDSFKASYVGPGLPFDVLYNKDSKRKTPSLVTLHGDDLLVGADAAALASRYPKETFSSVKMLLGRDAQDPMVQQHQALFDNKLSASPSNDQHRLALYKPDGTSYAPEEVLAMQLRFARDMAVLAANGDKSFDTVITVPSFFNQAQRQALVNAAELADLKLLSLINDGSAVAVNYAMTRSFPKAPAAPEIHMIYDAGASSIRSTIVSFASVPSQTGKDATQVTVNGVGWADGVGGLSFDDRIRSILAEQFQGDVQGNDRAMAKLLKEANRVKTVLSANSDSLSRVENLLPDVDFKGKVTRAEFQAACEDLTSAFGSPITQALEEAKLSIDDLTSVILVGGSSRVPMIQDQIKTIVPENKIAQNVNADEAAVMGAVLYGAGLSAQFKTKDIRVQDMTPYSVEMTYDSDESSVTAPIFGKNSKLASTMTVPFHKSSDFDLHFAYKTADGHAPLFDATITGFEKALANLTEEEIKNSTVQVTLEQSSSNLITVPKAVFALPERSSEPGVAGRLFNMLKGGKGTPAEDQEDAEEGDSAQESSEPTVKAAESRQLSVIFKESGAGPTALTESQKEAAKKRLREMEQAETRKKLREEARNLLEAFIYKSRDKLEGADLQQYATSGELSKIRSSLDQASSWIWDEGETAPTKDLRSKRTDLEKQVNVVLDRSLEAAARPALVASLQVILQKAQDFHASAVQNMTEEASAGEPTRHTTSDLDSLQNLIKSHTSWLEEGAKKQASLATNVDPVLKKSDLETRTKTLLGEIESLAKRRKPRVTKSSSSATTATEAPTGSPTGSAETEEASPTTTTQPKDEL